MYKIVSQFTKRPKAGVVTAPYFRSLSTTSQRLSAQRTFEQAKSALNSLNNEPDNELKLKIYALFKQATVGDCNKSEPGVMGFVEKFKWKAWDSLRGMKQDEASKQYTELIFGLVDAEQGTRDPIVQPAEHFGFLVESDPKGIMKISLNRPEKKNAITWKMYKSWAKILRDAATDSNVKLVAITGAGDYFSSGNDLSNFTAAVQSEADIKQMAKEAKTVLQDFVASFIDFPKPLIGLINGPAVGIVVTTLGLYDYVLSSNKATFHTPFTMLGQTPEGCSSYTFPRLMGYTRAADMLLFNRRLSAAEAVTNGLITRVTDETSFASQSQELLDSISSLPPETLSLGKHVLRSKDREALHAANVTECERLCERWTSEECKNAIAKFFRRKK